MIHYLKNKVGVDFANAQGVALKYYHSAGFCKIYYFHFIFEVMYHCYRLSCLVK